MSYCMNVKLEKLMPVSYTHLDVYKRQGLYNLVGQSLANAGQTYVSSAFGSVTGNAVSNVLSGTAVSYTHLRQCQRAAQDGG